MFRNSSFSSRKSVQKQRTRLQYTSSSNKQTLNFYVPGPLADICRSASWIKIDMCSLNGEASISHFFTDDDGDVDMK